MTADDHTRENLPDEYEPSAWEPVADHVQQYLSTNGAEGYDWGGAKTILLTTTGRKTGKTRISPLIRVAHGDGYIAIASQGGLPNHPAWYHNLVANPEVTVQDRDQVHELRARVADDAERAELWPIAVEQWPEYDEYQTRTERQIPLVVLEPR